MLETSDEAPVYMEFHRRAPGRLGYSPGAEKYNTR
jgi:hypothetical protein